MLGLFGMVWVGLVERGSVLTFRHHIEVDYLAGVGLELVVGVDERALKGAQVGPGVIVGHVEDVDGAVLQVLGPLAAVPVQTLVETRVDDFTVFVLIGVQLKKEAEHQLRRFWLLKKSFL